MMWESLASTFVALYAWPVALPKVLPHKALRFVRPFWLVPHLPGEGL